MKNTLLFFLLMPSLLLAQNPIVWDFSEDLEGWYTNSDALDVDLSWEDGYLVMNYSDNGVGDQNLVWFPQIYKEIAFSADSFSYLNIYYNAVDWPKTEPAFALIAFDNASGRAYFTFYLDPKANKVSIDLAGSYYPAWSNTTYEGNFTNITIEIPHNSYTSGDMASWFDIASTRIDKIELSNESFDPEVTDSLTAHWSFDTNFRDEISNITGVAGGKPEISELAAKTGSGALVLNGDYLTMPANEVFSSDDITFTFWMKTPAGGLGEGVLATVLSFENTDFKLSLKDGVLYFHGYRGVLTNLSPWINGKWTHVALSISNKTELTCYINGKRSDKTINTGFSDRLNNFVLGSTNLFATIDELSIYNYQYHISRSEIQDDQKSPPTANDTITSYDASWDEVLENSALSKSGMSRFNNPKFQYQTIGLGGTTMRVDPWGFASHRAPFTNQNSYNHKPSFGYEYWWDNSGHRYNPFLINAGYGTSFNPGTISAFEQNLDIRTGVLETRLTLTVGETTFTSVRETFITPEGVLVIRVQDNGAPSPLQLNLAINETVEWFGTYYAGEEDPFTRDAVHTSNKNQGATGGVVVVNRPNTSDCAIAVALEASSAITVSENSDVYSQTSADGTLIFYIVPKSSFDPSTPAVPWDHAWNAASAAKTTGYEVLKKQTADWWRDFLNVSRVSVPDEQVSKLYAQSLYYHGIYFGNTAIPPGCFGTDIYGFFGGICPEYDLNFSSFAMAYTGHIDETKNIADWVYNVLPRAKEHAVNGIRHHDVFRQYNGGAIYTTIMGYDGALTVQGEPFEGINLKQNYPGINAARMALNYLDFSDDQTFRDAAHDVLKSTTYVALQDLVFNESIGGFLDGQIPNCMQQGAALMGYDQCVKRGIAEPDWIIKYQDKILMSQGILNGDTLLSGGVGHNPVYGEGGATWFYPLWWATVIDKHDSRAVKAINNYQGTFQEYCFNNGWSGVHSAKVYRGDDALMWLKNFQRPDVLLDETSFAENAGPYGFNYTPEIGAHGAYICNLTQMLIDPDHDSIIDVFPAIPGEWEYQKISFEGLLTTGALSFSAERDINGAKVMIENKSNSVQKRVIRTKVPNFMEVADQDDLTIEDEFIKETISLDAGEKVIFEYIFNVELETGKTEVTMDESVAIYPNPNATGILNISGVNNVKDILIFSLNGTIVRRFHNQSNNYNIEGLLSGIYLVQIITSDDFSIKRLIIN